MCTMITERALMSGTAKGPKGWFQVRQANVSFDHPFNAPLDHAVNIDFVNEHEGLGARVAVEITADSARRLVKAILDALEQGEKYHLEELESTASVQGLKV